MTIRRFIILSVLLHAAIIAALYFISKHMAPPKMPQSQLMADLVSPDQIKPLPPVTARPQKPQLQPHRSFPPSQRLPKLPPPTPEELKKMPISGLPRPKSSAKSGQQAASQAPQTRTGPPGKPAGGEKPSNKPGYEAGGGPSSGRGKKHNDFNLAEAGKEAANYEAWQSEKKHSNSKAAIGFDTGDMKYIGYMQHLKEKIEYVWVYPQRAIEQRLQGDLDITFTINKNGTLSEVKVTRTSGYPVLDEAAVKALRDGMPYWPLPDAWHKDNLTIHGTFQYVYGGMDRYVR